MNLNFDPLLAIGYKSRSQIARRLTEGWLHSNMYCPRCGKEKLEAFPNNCPVADFFCSDCNSQFELKSKCGALGNRINDGAYDTMIKRITSNTTPDFLFLSYSEKFKQVTDVMIVPKHFFTPSIIEKRPPLAPTARRCGWVGCNILLDTIPEQGRVYAVKQGDIVDKEDVLKRFYRAGAIVNASINARGWMLDVLNCVNSIPNDFFKLSQMYMFEDLLSARHPENNNVQAKIRQQLQILRDAGFIKFLTPGNYQKTWR